MPSVRTPRTEAEDIEKTLNTFPINSNIGDRSLLCLKVVLLGTGNPNIILDRQGPSQLIFVKDEPILIDCGRGVLHQIERLKIPRGIIGHVFITHHHYDHMSDLDDVVLRFWVDRRGAPIRIYGPKYTKKKTDLLFNEIYKEDIESRIRVGKPTGYVKGPPELIVKEMAEGTVHQEQDWKATSALVDHWRTALPDFDSDALAFRIDSSEGSICISGDTIPCENLIRLAKGADVLVHDCLVAHADLNKSEFSRVMGTLIHTESGQVGKVAKKAGVKKLVLSHLGSQSPDLLKQMADDARSDFDGEVIMGEDLLEIET